MEDYKMSLIFRMHSVIQFNRPIKSDDYISPGGYTMTMDGKQISFDFCNYEGYIDSEHPCILHVMQKNPDFDSFPELYMVTPDMLRNVEKIDEFFVFTGESDETDLSAVRLLSVYFELPHNEWETIIIGKNVIKNANVGDVLNKDGEKVKNYRKAVLERAEKEYHNFLEELKTMTTKRVIELAYEKTLKEELLSELRTITLSNPSDWKTLYESAAPLAELYAEWIHNDLCIGELLRETIYSHFH